MTQLEKKRLTNFLNYIESQTQPGSLSTLSLSRSLLMPDGVWGSFKFVASEIYEAYNFQMQHLLHFVWPGLAMSLCLKCLCK